MIKIYILVLLIVLLFIYFNSVYRKENFSTSDTDPRGYYKIEKPNDDDPSQYSYLNDPQYKERFQFGYRIKILSGGTKEMMDEASGCTDATNSDLCGPNITDQLIANKGFFEATYPNYPNSIRTINLKHPVRDNITFEDNDKNLGFSHGQILQILNNKEPYLDSNGIERNRAFFTERDKLFYFQSYTFQNIDEDGGPITLRDELKGLIISEKYKYAENLVRRYNNMTNRGEKGQKISYLRKWGYLFYFFSPRIRDGAINQLYPFPEYIHVDYTNSNDFNELKAINFDGIDNYEKKMAILPSIYNLILHSKTSDISSRFDVIKDLLEKLDKLDSYISGYPFSADSGMRNLLKLTSILEYKIAFYEENYQDQQNFKPVMWLSEFIDLFNIKTLLKEYNNMKSRLENGSITRKIPNKDELLESIEEGERLSDDRLIGKSLSEIMLIITDRIFHSDLSIFDRNNSDLKYVVEATIKGGNESLLNVITEYYDNTNNLTDEQQEDIKKLRHLIIIFRDRYLIVLYTDGTIDTTFNFSDIKNHDDYYFTALPESFKYFFENRNDGTITKDIINSLVSESKFSEGLKDWYRTQVVKILIENIYAYYGISIKKHQDIIDKFNILLNFTKADGTSYFYNTNDIPDGFEYKNETHLQFLERVASEHEDNKGQGLSSGLYSKIRKLSVTETTAALTTTTLAPTTTTTLAPYQPPSGKAPIGDNYVDCNLSECSYFMNTSCPDGFVLLTQGNDLNKDTPRILEYAKDKCPTDSQFKRTIAQDNDFNYKCEGITNIRKICVKREEIETTQVQTTQAQTTQAQTTQAQTTQAQTTQAQTTPAVTTQAPTTTTIEYVLTDKQIEELKNDPNIYRGYLRQFGKADQDLIDAYQEYTNIRDFIQRKKYEDLKENLQLIKTKYENTKKKLENLLYNKYRPNRKNFYEKNSEFTIRMKSFLSNLKDSTPESSNVELQNKLVLKPNDLNSKNIELNKIDDQLYVVNINSSCLKYYGNKQYKAETCDLNDDGFLFRVVEIYDEYHFNQFIENNKISQSDGYKFPFYLIIPYSDYKKAVALRYDKLSINPINDTETRENIIFYK